MDLRYLILALTTRCNLACAYCYAEAGSTGMDMSDEIIRQGLDLAAAGGRCHVQITGGEPTLAPERIEKIAGLAAEKGRQLTLAIQTNGTRLTPELVKLFKVHGIQVGVSLDGPPEIHERLRGRTTATLRGLQLLERFNVPFRVTTVVTSANVAFLDKTVLLLAGFRNARGIGLDLLINKGRAVGSTAALPTDGRALQKAIPRMVAALDLVNAGRHIPLQLRERDLLQKQIYSKEKNRAFCHAGAGQSIAVHPDGRLFPCSQTMGDEEFCAGTVWHPDFKSLQILSTMQLTNDRCANCELADFCPGECPSRLHYNKVDDMPLACELYRAFWKTEQAGKKPEYPDNLTVIEA